MTGAWHRRAAASLPVRSWLLGPMLAAGLMLAAPAHVMAQTEPAPQPLPQAAPQPAPGSEERFEAWTLHCVTAEADGRRRCEMVQVLGDTESGQELLLMAIGYPDGSERPVAWLVLPLGVLLPPGIGLRIDQGEPFGFPIRSCDSGGCATPWALTDEDIAALKRGNELMVIFQDIEGKKLGLPVSLQGFTAAFSRLR